MLYSSNQTTQTVLPTNSTSKPTVSGSSGITASIANGTAVISGTPSSGLTRVTVGKTSVWLADKAWLAPRIWQPRVSGTNGNGIYDLSPRTSSVLVFGPYLVRNATIKGSTLAITGDLKSGETTDLEVLAPSSVRGVTFNGKSVKVSKTATGTLKGSVGVKDLSPKLPNLKTLEWKCTDSLPEIAVGFDDSKWTKADKTTTARPARYQPLGGKLMLYSDEYGYHQGESLVARVTTGFDGWCRKFGVPRSIREQCHWREALCARVGNLLCCLWIETNLGSSGYNFGFSAFLNGAFLGSGQGRSGSDAAGGIDLVNATYTFPAGVIGTENVLTVVVDNMGLDEDWNSMDEFKVRSETTRVPLLILTLLVGPTWYPRL